MIVHTEEGTVRPDGEYIYIYCQGRDEETKSNLISINQMVREFSFMTEYSRKYYYENRILCIYFRCLHISTTTNLLKDSVYLITVF
jgi:hypothetical protein